jgi:uncharacterized coiled-coil protein SlyX
MNKDSELKRLQALNRQQAETIAKLIKQVAELRRDLAKAQARA